MSSAADVMIERVRVLIQDRGYTYRQASDELKCPIRSVYRYAARAGLVPPNSNTASASAARRPKNDRQALEQVPATLEAASAAIAAVDERMADASFDLADSVAVVAHALLKTDLPDAELHRRYLAAIAALEPDAADEIEPAHSGVPPRRASRNS